MKVKNEKDKIMYSFTLIKNIGKAKIVYIFFVFLLFYSVFSSSSFAQENPTLTPTPTPDSINYALPYPGILPGNPFYILKIMRDRIILFLISDPLKKAEFDVLQADKRLSAGMYLFDQNPRKTDDISSVISKGNNYLFDSLNEINLAAKQGEDGSMFLGKIKSSTQKHIQVLQSLEKKANGNLLNSLKQEEQRAMQIEKEVDALINKN